MRTAFKLLFFPLCAFLLYSFAFIKENNQIDLIISNLEAYSSDYSPNKIYVQTDRSIYALEDTIWFKAYTLQASSHFATSASKVIYIDLLDSSGKKVLDKKLYAEKLGAASDLFIDRDWTPGNYTLRAYTKYMLNQNQEYIFNKEIQIIDIKEASDEILKSSDPVKSIKVNPSQPSIQMNFFPESGDLIAGIESRVAIRVENFSPDQGEISGNIEDKFGKLVMPFKVFERGYGLTSFTPEVGNKYFAKINNDPKLYPLPEVKSEGYHIMALGKSNKVSIVVSSNIKSGLKNGCILIHNRGQLVFHKTMDDSADESFGIQLNTNEIPSGVTHISFFDKDGIPRAERLLFVDNIQSESVIKTDKTKYTQREKVELNLAVINSDIKSYDCSVSVFDKSSLNSSKASDNIKSWMLLNSDLRGEIKDPTYYFEKIGDHKRATMLDLVMMTHGWRRFTWDDMRKKNAFQNLEFEKELGLYVKGYTSKLLNSKSPIQSQVKLNFLNNNLDGQEVLTADDGRFVFGPFIIEDSIVAIIQARKFKAKSDKDFLDANKNLDINLETSQYLNLEIPELEERDNSDYDTYASFIKKNKDAQALKDQYHDMEVKLSEIVFTAKRKTKEEKMNDIARKRSYYGNPSNRLIIEDIDRMSNLSVFDLLRRVPGVTVTGAFPNQSAIIRGFSSINSPSTPLYLIDGIPVTLDFVNQINPVEVLFIDVLKGANAAIYGVRGGNGVIAIYTGSDPDSNIQRRQPGIVDIIVKGFDKNRQFYSPEYSKNVSSVYQPDVRTTLYWNPYVLLSADKEDSLSFHTSDNPGQYVVTLEGLSADGEPIFDSYEFTVQ